MALRKRSKAEKKSKDNFPNGEGIGKMEKHVFQVLSKVFFFNASATTAVFPGGPRRGNPTMTTSTITARRKVDPQHYVEGKRMQTYEPNLKWEKMQVGKLIFDKFCFYTCSQTIVKRECIYYHRI